MKAILKLSTAQAKTRKQFGDSIINFGLIQEKLATMAANIYASESLFMAGIRPTTRAIRISRARSVLLHNAIREVLTQAVTKGGSTLKDFSNAEGKSGYFQLEAMVYDRAGQPCRVCGTLIKALRQGQRSTFYCPVCQKP